MKAPPALLLLLASLLAAAAGPWEATAARSQQAGTQAVSGSAGYQYDVPATWQIESSPGATVSLAASADGTELAYVSIVSLPPPGSGIDEGSEEVLHAITQASITQESGRAGYTVLQSAEPASVAGADAAEQGEISYSSAEGTVTDEYILTAVRGQEGYTLVVSLPAGANASAAAGAILSSFVLTDTGPASI